jgi:hypothetical protein
MATQTGSSTSSESIGSGSPDRIQEAASGLIDQAGRTAEAQASWTMTQASDTLEQVARAFRDAGQGVKSERPEIATVANSAAEQVERAATYLREHDANDALNAATDFARRQPMIVVGGALLAGLALGRFLRSASGDGHSGTSGSEWNRGYGYGSSARPTDRYSSATDYGAGTASGVAYGSGRGYGAGSSTVTPAGSTNPTGTRPSSTTRSRSTDATGSSRMSGGSSTRSDSTTTGTTKQTKGT